jgi:methionyl-tRNA formyltransferase
MKKQSLVFLGSKPIGYHCLAYLIQHSDQLNIEIQGILTNDNARFDQQLSLRKLASDNNIPLINHLDDLQEVDYLYSVQYHEILKQQHIQKARKIALNLHMAPLPEYRGCNQFSFAIVDGKTEFGTTIHQLDHRIDHGDILFEKRFPIPAECWVSELYELTYDASFNLFQETIELILNGSYTRTPQQTFEASRGCALHFRQEINILKHIQLDWAQDKIQRHIRATYMPGFEPPYTMVGGEKIYFSKTWQEHQ